ncbi:probable endo-1,3(4)-beta-glucanase AFLA_105200 [Salarias fasciatus]|uniref:probable endo-1,3(4)-beta-glucanase AFLA_105200 n=1 Tax=Salarias fasciatus TaxID=181472 RepID=UPI0011769070|nr:probable endo-1,3(4)-beta-glucanase AFLA_105200 [Salarias fasciatus]
MRLTSFLILAFLAALLAASVLGQGNTTTDEGLTPQYSTSSTSRASSGNGFTFSNTVTVSKTSRDMNATSSNSTIMPSMNVTDVETPTQSGATELVTTSKQMTTPKPIVSNGTEGRNDDKRTTVKPNPAESDSTGIIILVIIILVAAVFAGACYLARRRGRRYSVDFTSRPDETNIPLSAVEPEAPADTLPYNGVQTFETEETPANEQQESEEKPEAPEEPKAESDKSVVDPSAESAAPLPDGTPEEPKADAAEQQESPPAPVETSMEDKTDDEGAVSSKTSVESLKETNENNSNSAESSRRRDLKMRDIVWEVPLKCPV